MGNKAGKKKRRSESDSSESAGNDLPSDSSPPNCESGNTRIEIPEPAPLLFSQDTGPDKESEPPPDESSEPPNSPSLEVGSEPPHGDLPPAESCDPPNLPSLTAECESNLKSQQARTPLKVSRQERRRKERMKRKFKGTLTSYTFVLVILLQPRYMYVYKDSILNNYIGRLVHAHEMWASNVRI